MEFVNLLRDRLLALVEEREKMLLEACQLELATVKGKVEGQALLIECPNRFTEDRITERLLGSIAQHLKSLGIERVLVSSEGWTNLYLPHYTNTMELFCPVHLDEDGVYQTMDNFPSPEELDLEYLEQQRRDQ